MKKKDIERRKKFILELLGDPIYKPMRLREISTLLRLSKEEKRDLYDVLDELCYEGKVSVDNKGRYEKYFAVGGEIGLVDGTKLNVWFLKGTFSYPQEQAKTEDASTDTNGMSLTFNAVRTIFEFAGKGSCKRVVMDTGVSEMNESKDFFEQVVTPANVGTLVKKKVNK